MVAQEIQETLREITMLGFGLILTAHSKETPTGEKDAEGNPIMMAKPDLSKNVYTICNAVCDLIGYIKLEHNKDGTSTRYIYTRSTPTVFAGSRWQYLEPKLPFSYNDLVKGISDAIDKSAQHGATVVDHVDTTFIKERSFDSIMSEAKDLWMNYLNIDNEEEQEHRILIVKEIIRKIFGNAEFKLSQATPGQSELVELFCDEMKSL